MDTRRQANALFGLDRAQTYHPTIMQRKAGQIASLRMKGGSALVLAD